MKGLALILAALPALAAVSGTVANGTTGKPAAGITVTLFKFGNQGMEPADSTKTDAEGRFSIAKVPDAPGPKMVRVEVDGISYNKIMPMGSPTEGLAITVYDASKQPGDAKVSKHMILFEPANGQMTVIETFIVENDGKTTWSDPQNGTVKFFQPAGASNLDAKGRAPDGLPVPVPTAQTGKSDISAIKFECKPGTTQFDLTYTVPYTAGEAYKGLVPTKDENTYLIAPNGVTLESAGLNDLGTEPKTQAHIWGLQGTTYNIKLSGAEVAPPSDAAGGNDQPDSQGPQIEEIMPRVNNQTKTILAMALGILGLGFALLYRAGNSAKEQDERGRR